MMPPREISPAPRVTAGIKLRAPQRDLWPSYDLRPRRVRVAERMGGMIAGTRRREHIEQTGVNYVLLQIAFGDQTHEDEIRTLKLFATEIMPAFT